MRRLRKLNKKPCDRMVLQWHITERCDLNCSHCYQDDARGEELEFIDFLWILDQFQDLLNTRKRDTGRPVMGHVTLTGGEPFLRDDFMDLLQAVAEARAWTRFSILSHGGLIDKRIARELARLRPAYVQLSLEGAEATHDRIRGAGSFRKTVAGIGALKRAGIPVMISFTAHKANYQEFGEVVRIACRRGVAKVWADRLVPLGRGAAADALSPEETRAFFRIMRQARDNARKRWFCKTEVAMHRALQFLEGNGPAYHCSAGKSLLALLPDGTLVPCRRLPIPVGNVMETPLSELYESSPVLRSLRDPLRLPAECGGCSHRKRCRGGLRCLSHATTGDPFSKDPGCYLPAVMAPALDEAMNVSQ